MFCASKSCILIYYFYNTYSFRILNSFILQTTLLCKEENKFKKKVK